MAYVLFEFVEWDDIRLAHHDLSKVAYIDWLTDDLLVQAAQLQRSKFGWHHLKEHLWLLAGNAVKLLQCVLDDLVMVKCQGWDLGNRLPCHIVEPRTVSCRKIAWFAALDTHETKV